MVTSQKISEKIMENRGSKSDFKSKPLISRSLRSVKEQRVDGSWYKRMLNYLVFKVYSNEFRNKLSSQNPFLANNKHVGNTGYKGGAPFYLTRKLKLVNKLSNKSLNFTNVLNFSTASQIAKLSGWWVTGFVDAESCFRISIIKNKNYKGNPWSPSLYSGNGLGNSMPLSVRLYFQIGLHLKDEKILKLIQSTLGVGKIYRSKTRLDSVELQVSSFKDMSAIIKFFDKYPLITQKWADYLLFKKACPRRRREAGHLPLSPGEGG